MNFNTLVADPISLVEVHRYCHGVYLLNVYNYLVCIRLAGLYPHGISKSCSF